MINQSKDTFLLFLWKLIAIKKLTRHFKHILGDESQQTSNNNKDIISLCAHSELLRVSSQENYSGKGVVLDKIGIYWDFAFRTKV